MPLVVASLLAIMSLAGAPPAGASTPGGAPSPSNSPAKTTTTTVSIHDTAYWMDASNGAVYSFGGAPDYGTMAGKHLNEPIVGMATMPTGKGYWMVASDGGIFTFGSARFDGSMGGRHLNEPIVGMAAMPTGLGYWMVASDGGIFTFGSARFDGSMGGRHLNEPIVGMAATRTGLGYWLVASDGGIFTFGAAATHFYGSTASTKLTKPVNGMSVMPTGDGYWLVSTGGGVYAFGVAKTHFYGSLAGQAQPAPVVAMTSNYSGTGYWLSNASGAVTGFGTAIYWGSAPTHIAAPVVGMGTAVGDGDPGDSSFQAGSYGYDVSNYQCTRALPKTHAVGVVEVAGWPDGPVNSCLAQEVTWAAGGLNLYTFIAYGTTHTAEPGCTKSATITTTTACNFGYGAALSAYHAAQSTVGTRANVPWWLDVEKSNWTSTVGKNRSVVAGAYDALRYDAGINTVGFYFSVENWNDIVGDYNPSAPLFPAWWTGPTPAYKCENARTVATNAGDYIPSGPIQLLQYTDNANSYEIDGDYAC